MLINAILGITLLELTWKSVKLFRNPPSKELNDLFPAMRRNDAPNWKKWKLYPGAMFLLIPRFIFIIVLLILLWLFVKIFLCGHDKSKPLKGCRKYIINFTYKISSRLVGLFGYFTWYSYRYLSEAEVDYSEYLGTNEILPAH